MGEEEGGRGLWKAEPLGSMGNGGKGAPRGPGRDEGGYEGGLMAAPGRRGRERGGKRGGGAPGRGGEREKPDEPRQSMLGASRPATRTLRTCTDERLGGRNRKSEGGKCAKRELLSKWIWLFSLAQRFHLKDVQKAPPKRRHENI